MKVTIVGGGTVGSAFASRLISKKIVLPEHLIIVERDQGICDELRRTLGCYAATLPYPTMSDSDLIMLAVKPQDFEEMAVQIGLVLKPGPLILSTMTGIRVARMTERFPAFKNKIVRSMPNLPIIVGEGVTACYFSPGTAASDVEKVEKILSACGNVLSVKSEDLIDAATAVSASGPGFLAYLIEELITGTQAVGFDRETAESMIFQTLSGTMALFNQGVFSTELLQKRVTTKNGTTHAAITVMKDRELSDVLHKAIGAAFKRAQELGQ